MGVIAAICVIASRRKGEELALYAAPALGAGLVQMYGQAFSDAVWSSGAYQIIALSMIVLIGIFLKERKAMPADEEAAEVAAFKGKAAFIGFMSAVLVLTLLFTVTIGYNASTRSKMTKGSVTIDMLAKAADAEKYEYADYYISYLNSEVANPGIASAELCEKYADKILKLDSNSAYRSAAEFYLNKNNDEKAFAALDRGASYVRSSGATWQYIFTVLEDYFDIMGPNSDAAMARAEERGESYETLLKYYDDIRARNAEYLDNIELAPRNYLFVGRLLELKDKNAYDDADVIATILACAMFDTKYACDANLDGVPDFVSVADGISWQADANGGESAFKASVTKPSSLLATFAQKYGGEYAVKVYCDKPNAVHFKSGGEPINTSYADGCAVTYLKLDTDVNASTVGQVEISFDAPCEISRITMFATDYLNK
jgi:hypothetical protein